MNIDTLIPALRVLGRILVIAVTSGALAAIVWAALPQRMRKRIFEEGGHE